MGASDIMSDWIQVITTVGSRIEAEKISREVIKSRLAGCAQILGPITSIYRWKGELKEDREWFCIMKTRLSLYEELESVIQQNHSYEVPEILATPVISGSMAYVRWLDQELRS